jgi:hypothetical protein
MKPPPLSDSDELNEEEDEEAELRDDEDDVK